MRRDLESNKMLEGMVDVAIRDAHGADISYIGLAIGAYPRIVDDRRQELAISRLSQQVGAKVRRKRPKQPIIPGLLDEAAQG
jgi:hypothetical protein